MTSDFQGETTRRTLNSVYLKIFVIGFSETLFPIYKTTRRPHIVRYLNKQQ